MNEGKQIEVQQATEVRNGFREVLNETVMNGRVTVIERYSKPEAVIIPYEWLMKAHNGDFVQLVYQITEAVRTAS